MNNQHSPLSHTPLLSTVYGFIMPNYQSKKSSKKLNITSASFWRSFLAARAPLTLVLLGREWYKVNCCFQTIPNIQLQLANQTKYPNHTKYPFTVTKPYQMSKPCQISNPTGQPNYNWTQTSQTMQNPTWGWMRWSSLQCQHCLRCSLLLLLHLLPSEVFLPFHPGR